jgi:hypothetical protein
VDIIHLSRHPLRRNFIACKPWSPR